MCKYCHVEALHAALHSASFDKSNLCRCLASDRVRDGSVIASQQVVVCQHDKQITQHRRHHSTDLVSAHTDSYLPAFLWWTTRKCKIVVRVWALSVTDRSQSCVGWCQGRAPLGFVSIYSDVCMFIQRI